MVRVFSVVFFLVFIVVICYMIYFLFRSVTEWSRNNNSPVLTVDVKVAAKRINVSQHTQRNGGDIAMDQTYSSTAYYVTFEVESGDRMELKVPGSEYGLIAEHDTGKLTFQGTRYKSFERAYNG